MATIVGEIQYDVRLNLASLKKDTSQAEKIVNDSYKKMSQAQKRSTSGGTSSGAITQAEEITRVTKAQVEATKQAAQASYNSISTYTPQIQRQFLAVERANNQVFNASTRSATAIQKYGSESVQAQRATNALNVAVQNQAIAQTRLDSSLKSTGNSISFSRTGVVALTASVGALALAIGSNLNNAVSRSDTLNNFPKVLQAMGESQADATAATEKLSDRLQGLPTSLQDGTKAVQGFIAAGLPVNVATEGFLAFNNALLAAGASTIAAQQSTVQLQQALSRGRIEGEEWNSIIANTPTFLKAMTLETGKTREQLRELYRLSPEKLIQDMIRLNVQGGGGLASLDEQARNAVDGIGTGFANLQNAITRSIASVIETIGRENITNGIEAIGDGFEATANTVNSLIRAIQPLMPIFQVAGSGALATAVTVGTLTGAIVVATKAMAGFRTMLTLVSKHPIIATLSILAGVISSVAVAVGMMNGQTDGIADTTKDIDTNLGNWKPSIGGASDEAAKFAKQMAKIDEQIAQTNEEYRYNLAQLVADKNKNIAQLQTTLSEEQKAYDNTYAERLASFNKSQNEEEASHSEKTRALQNQIDFLSRYNTQANQRRLSELQFELAQENAQFKKSTDIKQAEFDAQTKSAFEEFAKRRDENQRKLDEELSLLQKHREDVLGVRDIILRDEIENLKRSRDEQLRSLAQQKQDAISSNSAAGYGAGQAFNDQFSAWMNNIKENAKNAGTEAGFNFTDRLNNALKLSVENPRKFWQPMIDSWNNVFGLLSGSLEVKNGKIVVKPGGGGGGGGWADGGYTGAGGKNEVAGLVHRGEYVLPKEQVNQATGMPDWEKIGAVGGSTSVNVSVNMSGVMASGKSDLRAIGVQIGKVINETVMAKTGKVGIQGI